MQVNGNARMRNDFEQVRSTMTVKPSLFLAIVLVTSALGQATHPAAPTPRTSVDAVELPEYVATFPPSPNVPLIKQRLGTLPEKCVRKLYNSQKSRDLLQKRTKIDAAFDWFGWDVGNANVCGMKLTDGRVTAIALIFNGMGDSTYNRLRQDIDAFQQSQRKREANVPWVYVKLVRRGKTGAEFVAAIQPAKWYALTRDLRPNIRDGMLSERPVIGMTKEELFLAMGSPSSQSEAKSGNARYIWDGSVPSDFRAVQVDAGSMPIAASDDDTDPMTMIGNYERWGSFIVDVEDGVVTKVTEPRK